MDAIKSEMDQSRSGLIVRKDFKRIGAPIMYGQWTMEKGMTAITVDDGIRSLSLETS